MSKRAIITGITGQDGAYLSKLLLSKGYEVIGLTRNLRRADRSRLAFLDIDTAISLREIDLLNPTVVAQLLADTAPHEVYNLAAQSSVGLSFDIPVETFSYNTQSVLNILEAIRTTDPSIRFYQASSSEMFGNVALQNLPIRESLLFHPVSPYGISKASAHWLTVNYREAYGLFTACGILFNHESALRGERFVVKKIVNAALKIAAGDLETLTLGNVAIQRDWGYAPKYVEAMWLMLQSDTPDDYVICSGAYASLQDVAFRVFAKLGLDVARHLRLDTAFMRSLDLNIIYGDSTKAQEALGWTYDITLDQLVQHLIEDERQWIHFLEQR